MRINITQKPISLKINIAILAKLDAYCEKNGIKRNAAINAAIAKMIGATR